MKTFSLTISLLILSWTFLSAQTPFITTWETTSDNESITIPTTGGGYNYDVDWGDGNQTYGYTGNAIHTYTIGGTYQVEITGDFPRIYFLSGGQSGKIMEINQWGSIEWQSMKYAFYGCSDLEVVASDSPDLSIVEDMNRMFLGCTNLSGNFSNWDVSNVTNMPSMFAYADVFNQDIGSWDVSNVTDMSSMFVHADEFNQDIGNWDVSNVTNMDSMFCSATLSTANYDALLDGWSQLTLQPNVPFSGGNSMYCTGADARQKMIDEFGWSITDAGVDPDCESVPDCSMLFDPINGENDVKVSTDLNWIGIENATGYYLTIGTSSGGNEILNYTNMGNNNWYDPPANFPYSTTIFVTINPYNEFGVNYDCNEESFTTEGFVCLTPSVQTSNLTFNAIGSTQMTVSWDKGSGSRRVVKIKTSNSFNAPINGTDPIANSEYSNIGNQQVVYNGTGSSVTITGLSPNTAYWFRAYEANCSGSYSIYKTSTATGNPKSQATTSDVSLYGDLTITNKIVDHCDIDELYTLYHGSPTVTNKPMKVCADGTTATYIKLYATNPSAINFQLLDEGGNVVADAKNEIATNPDIYGKLGIPYTFFGNYVEVAYTHPVYMDVYPGTNRSLTLHILLNNVPIPEIKFPVRIYRPPILFVHGLWGDGESFKTMETNFWATPGAFQEQDLMLRLDYEETNDATFLENKPVVPNGITSLLNTIREKGYSASKVDIVAHSMGGVLSRDYLQTSYCSCLSYQNDINKLITIDSPLRGTQAANFLLDSLNAYLRKKLAKYMNMDCNAGAIKDLRVNSTQIAKLQTGSWNHHNTPLYTVNSTIDFDIADGNDGNGDKRLIKAAYWLNRKHFKSCEIDNSKELLKQVYIYETNDLIVPISSQKGGVPLTNPVSFECVHTESKDLLEIISFTKEKLRQNPSEVSDFWHDGFGNLPTLDVRHDWCIPDDYEAIIIQDITDSVWLNNPFASQIYHPGDLVEVNSMGSVGIVGMMLICEKGTDSYSFPDIDTNFINHSFRIDEDFIGELNILCLGQDAYGSIYMDSVKVFSVTESPLDSIRIYPEYISVGTGFSTSFEVNGYYQNGLTGRLDGTLDLIINLGDSSIVEHQGSNLLMGIDTGYTKLFVEYQGLADTVDVKVYFKEFYGSASFDVPTNQLCQYEQISYENKSNGNPDSILWYFESGVPEYSMENNPEVTYQTAGAYDILLVAFYPTYIDTFYVQNYMNVKEAPDNSIMFEGEHEICQGDSVELSATSDLSYRWNTGADSQSIVVSTTGDYMVTVTAENGCLSISDLITINVNPNPIPIIQTEGKDTICPGDELVLKANEAVNYLWNTGETTQSIAVTQGGDYLVEVIDSNGCTGLSDTVTVSMYVSPEPVIQPQELDTICLGDTLQLSSSDAASYFWNTGETSQSITVNQGGNYFVEVIDTNGCFGMSDTVSIQTFDQPVVDLGPDTIVTTSILLDAGNPGSSFEWNTGDTTQTLLVSETGWYSVQVTNVHGCRSQDSIYIELVTGTITLDDKHNIKIYPNPNNGTFTISGQVANMEQMSLKIFNTSGQIVYESDTEEISGEFLIEIKLGRVPEGIYNVVLQMGASIYSGTIIKQF